MSLPRHAPPGYVCPFCLLVAGIEDDRVLSAQNDVVFWDGATTAFVSSHPYAGNPGHVLVIPNAHFENLYELPDEVGARAHATARRVALAMKAAYGCAGISPRQHREPAAQGTGRIGSRRATRTCGTTTCTSFPGTRGTRCTRAP